jgi:2-polyprenyl-6-methoxyphenol hydroxylase-like FAD-dependent oxidoreductase
MSEYMEDKITIIGAGISGLATAFALKRGGISVSLYEQLADYSPCSGMILGTNALKALDALGILEKVIKSGESSNQYHINNHHGKRITKIQSGKKDYPLFTFILQEDLINILLEELGDEHIFYQKKLVFISTDENKAQLFFEDGTIVKTDYLIGCDGLNSVIRKQLFPNRQLRFAGSTCWRGITKNFSEPFPNAYTETWGPKGRFGCIALSDNTLYWYALKSNNHNHQLYKWETRDLVDNFRDYPPVIQKIIQHTANENLSCSKVYNLESLAQYVYDHILLLGDAAHPTPPNLGQGACLALEDAVFLAKCITKESSLESAIHYFEEMRLSRNQKILQESCLMDKVALLETPLLCTVRNKVMEWMPSTFHENRLQMLQNFVI